MHIAHVRVTSAPILDLREKERDSLPTRPWIICGREHWKTVKNQIKRLKEKKERKKHLIKHLTNLHHRRGLSELQRPFDGIVNPFMTGIVQSLQRKIQNLNPAQLSSKQFNIKPKERSKEFDNRSRERIRFLQVKKFDYKLPSVEDSPVVDWKVEAFEGRKEPRHLLELKSKLMLRLQRRRSGESFFWERERNSIFQWF